MNAKVNYLRLWITYVSSVGAASMQKWPLLVTNRSSARAKAFGRIQDKIDLSVVQCFSRRALLGSLVVKDTRVLVVEVAKIDLRGLNTNISFFVGFPRVVSCHWCGSRTNKVNLGKLYLVFKSTKCYLHHICFWLTDELLWICDVINLLFW